MDRDGLLKAIAETGYNIGFGAKKTFATYDIVEKAPGWIGFISLGVGIFGPICDALVAKVPSAILLCAGIASLYTSFYKGGDYKDTGEKLTALFNRLRLLYRTIQGGGNVNDGLTELKAIEAEFNAVAVSKQIFLSDWYAHYKFFAQTQTGWLDEQLHFGWWKDKVPLSAKLVLFLIAALAIALCYASVWHFLFTRG